MADPGNRERGLRAALNNPRVSEQAKQRDREILEAEFGEHIESPEPAQTGSRRRASGGKKSASTGPHSSSATEEAQQGFTDPQASSSRMKARRASSGEGAPAGLHEMTEGKDTGNV
jgi:hypothetical protein